MEVYSWENHLFQWAIFHGYVSHNQRVKSWEAEIGDTGPSGPWLFSTMSCEVYGAVRPPFLLSLVSRQMLAAWISYGLYGISAYDISRHMIHYDTFKTGHILYEYTLR